VRLETQEESQETSTRDRKKEVSETQEESGKSARGRIKDASKSA
jgi:hypothetical protein